MPGFLLDTNVLIAWFGEGDAGGTLDKLMAKPDSSFHTSIICLAEFLSGCTPADAAAMKKIVQSGEIELVPFEGIGMAESAAFFRKSVGLKMPDAIVAAAAREKRLILFTRDADFRKKVAGKIQLLSATYM